MICRSCLRQAAGLSRRPQSLRSFSTSFAARNASPAAPGTAPATADSTPPLTTPLEESQDSKPALSICVPGTVLTGLNYFKGKTDPVAKEDSAYPDWLWNCLEVQKKDDAETDESAGDEFSKSKKLRRLALKRQRQLEAEILATGNLEALAPKIPLQQQSINLPGAESGSLQDAIVAAEKREELRKAMRKERKAKIKEANYLKSM